MEILRVENLVKTYGEGENQVNAVDDISLSVEKGEICCNCRRKRKRKVNASAPYRRS